MLCDTVLSSLIRSEVKTARNEGCIWINNRHLTLFNVIASFALSKLLLHEAIKESQVEIDHFTSDLGLCQRDSENQVSA